MISLPSPSTLLRLALALTIGSLGGLLFTRWQMPLPWMLGSISATTLAAILRAPVAVPRQVRPPMTAVIGVLLGSGFTPALFLSIPGWWATVLGLAVYMVVAGGLCVAYFRVVGRLDPVTAFFAGMPGGLMEMMLIGEAKGGDARSIALVHSARILLVVFTVPFLIQWLTGTTLGGRAGPGVPLMEAPLTWHLWLAGTAIVGVFVGRWLRFPAAFLLGPFVVSAAVHALGISTFRPSTEIVNVAQVVLGSLVGSAFVGTPVRRVLAVIGLSIGSTTILLGVTIAVALGVASFTEHEIVPLILAYSPGGLPEMSLIAVALQIEAAFVAAHHAARILMVAFGASPAFRLLGWQERPRE